MSGDLYCDNCGGYEMRELGYAVVDGEEVCRACERKLLAAKADEADQEREHEALRQVLKASLEYEAAKRESRLLRNSILWIKGICERPFNSGNPSFREVREHCIEALGGVTE